MKSLLLIDFYKTLCFDKYWRGMGEETREKIEGYVFGTTLASEWMQGKYSSEEINRMVAKKFSLEYERLWDVFVSDCKSMHVEQSDLDAIESLGERFFIVLVTDNMDSLNRFTFPALGLERYFDDFVNSFSEKRLKDREFLVDLVKKYQVDISQAVLIDDSKALCTIFTEMGGKAFCATGEKPLGVWLSKLRGD